MLTNRSQPFTLHDMNASTHHLLSTVEAAALAGVGPSTIKRWTDMGLLPCVRTAGGHRRFDRRIVLSLASSGGDLPSMKGFGEVWVERLIREGPQAIEAALLDLKADHGTWAATADAFGPVLVALGQAWTSGEISVLDEHVGSERLSRTLAWLARSVPVPPSAPTALVATGAGDPHTLGLRWVELVLREAGWNVLWAGRSAPAADVAATVRARAAQMVALSASSASVDAGTLAIDIDQIGAACIETGALLVLGGQGAWPQTPAAIAKTHRFVELAQLALLERTRGRSTALRSFSP